MSKKKLDIDLPALQQLIANATDAIELFSVVQAQLPTRSAAWILAANRLAYYTRLQKVVRQHVRRAELIAMEGLDEQAADDVARYEVDMPVHPPLQKFDMAGETAELLRKLNGEAA